MTRGRGGSGAEVSEFLTESTVCMQNTKFRFVADVKDNCTG